jgi:hypothetical protein
MAETPFRSAIGRMTPRNSEVDCRIALALPDPRLTQFGVVDLLPELGEQVGYGRRRAHALTTRGIPGVGRDIACVYPGFINAAVLVGQAHRAEAITLRHPHEPARRAKPGRNASVNPKEPVLGLRILINAAKVESY